MDSDHDRILEQQVQRVLQRLPELPAPRTLAPRVLAAIADRRLRPWYQRAWQTWPLNLQIISMTLLAGSFGAFCFAAWQLTQAAGYTETMEAIKEVISRLAAVWNVLRTLLWAAVLVLKQLGTPYVVGCAAAAALGYAVWVALGTLWVRLASQRS